MPNREKKVLRLGATAELYQPKLLILFFLVPALFLYLLFFIYPMAQAVALSLFRGSASAEHFEFVGFANFKKLLFHDAYFWNSLWHNVLFILIGGSFTLVLSLTIAVALTYCGRLRTFFRVVFIFPNVMAVVAISILWSFIFNPSFGILNAVLRLLKMPHLCHAWLGEPGTALWSVIIIHVWSVTGFYIILFYAGLLRIPSELLEAAKIDGASGFQTFFYVTLPLLSEILKIAVIYIIITSVKIFALVFIVNETQSNRYNDVLLTYLYEQGFINGNFGYACAIGVMMLIFALMLTVIISRLFRQKVIEI